VSLLSPYRAVLRTPHACGAFAASLAGRLCYGIVSLSLLLTLTAGGRDYGLAGLVMALFGLTIVLVSPFRAWMVDRHGPRRALPPLAGCFAAMLVAIAMIPPRSGAGDAAIAVLAAAAGACAPPLGVVMRTLRGALIDDHSVLQAAYSLDGVAEELLYVTGPVVTGVIVIASTPALGLLVSAGLVAAGTVLFLRSPAFRRWPAPAWAGSGWSSWRSARPGTTPQPCRGSRRRCRPAARSAASATARCPGGPPRGAGSPCWLRAW
jgi:MFS family permease